MAGGAIPLAIIGLGVLIFKFRDQIGAALQAVGQFFVDTFMIIPNFIGNVFNGAMDMARNAFNRLPNIVQQAIKVATAPLRGFIKILQSALRLLGKVEGAKTSVPKPSPTSTSISTSTSSSSTSRPSLPKTDSYAFPGQDMSPENIGAGYTGFTSTAGISSSTTSTAPIISTGKSSSVYATKLPSGGYSITQNTSRPTPKPPNINIQTGNVTQMDGTNYVTTNDLQQAVQSATTQTMNYIQAGGVTHYL